MSALIVCVRRNPAGIDGLALVQPRVLRLSLFQDRDVGVGVFPEGEEILVGNLGPDFIPRQRGGAALSKIRQCAYRRIHYNSRMVEFIIVILFAFSYLVSPVYSSGDGSDG